MPLEASSEAEWIALAAAGDSDAFGALVAPHLGMFYNSILRVLGEPADAQDALQNALLAIHQDLPKIQGRSKFSSWAYSICVNAALMLRRSRVRRREDPMEGFLSQNDPESTPMEEGLPLDPTEPPEAFRRLEMEEMRARMMAALDRLPDGQRMVFVLRDLEDWSHEDIAEHLGITPGLVRQRLHRARMFLQERMRAQLLGRSS